MRWTLASARVGRWSTKPRHPPPPVYALGHGGTQDTYRRLNRLDGDEAGSPDFGDPGFDCRLPPAEWVPHLDRGVDDHSADWYCPVGRLPVNLRIDPAISRGYRLILSH